MSLGESSEIGSVTELTWCLVPGKEVCKGRACLLRGLVATERAGPNLVEVFPGFPAQKRRCLGDSAGAQRIFWAAPQGSQPHLELGKGLGYPCLPLQLRKPRESPCRGTQTTEPGSREQAEFCLEG